MIVAVKDISRHVLISQRRANGAGDAGALPPFVVAEWSSLATIEGRYDEKMLAHTGGNKQAAARLLDVDRKTLERMIKRHNISVERIRGFPSQAA